MSGVFDQLQAEQEKQQKDVKKDVPPKIKKSSAQKSEHKSEQKSEHKIAQKDDQLLERVSILPDGEKIEELSFRLRREKKVKVSTNIPESWKKDLDRLSAELGVGKYDLLLFIISTFLKNNR